MGLSFPIFQQGDALTIFGINRHYTMETRIGIPQQWKEFVTLLNNHYTSALNASMYGVSWNAKADCSSTT